MYGDVHEYIEGMNYDRRENNMDLWNNSIGREVVHNIKVLLALFIGNVYKNNKTNIYKKHKIV